VKTSPEAKPEGMVEAEGHQNVNALVFKNMKLEQFRKNRKTT